MLEDLVFVGNPLEEKHTAEGDWRKQVSTKLKHLKKLDGIKYRVHHSLILVFDSQKLISFFTNVFSRRACYQRGCRGRRLKEKSIIFAVGKEKRNAGTHTHTHYGGVINLILYKK